LGQREIGGDDRSNRRRFFASQKGTHDFEAKRGRFKERRRTGFRKKGRTNCTGKKETKRIIILKITILTFKWRGEWSPQRLKTDTSRESGGAV